MTGIYDQFVILYSFKFGYHSALFHKSDIVQNSFHGQISSEIASMLIPQTNYLDVSLKYITQHYTCIRMECIEHVNSHATYLYCQPMQPN